jgi:hypothetical protein
MTALSVFFFVAPAIMFLIALAVFMVLRRNDDRDFFDKDINQAAQEQWNASRTEAEKTYTDPNDR